MLNRAVISGLLKGKTTKYKILEKGWEKRKDRKVIKNEPPLNNSSNDDKDDYDNVDDDNAGVTALIIVIMIMLILPMIA